MLTTTPSTTTSPSGTFLPARVGPGLRTLALANGVPAFTAAEGLFDHMQYLIERPVAFLSAEAAEEFVAVVGDRSGHTTPLFSAVRGRGGKTRFVIDGERWHLSGFVELRLNDRNEGLLRADLNLNPTRWMAALPHTRLAELAELDANDLLRRTPSELASITLDGNDNHLHGERRRAHAITKRDVLLHLYLDAVEGLLNAQLLDDPALPPGVRLGRLKLPASPSRAEVYQEFRAADAPSVVETIREAALAGMSNVTATTHPAQPSRLSSETRFNAVSLRIPLSKTVYMSLYAKAMNVIRIEVCYTDDMREHAASRYVRGVALSRRDVLAGLHDDAAKRTRTLLEGLTMRMNRATKMERRDAFDLLEQLQAVTGGNRQHARDLLSLLGNYGGVTETGPAGVAPSNIIRALERRGVVQRLPYRHGNAAGGRRFTLTPPYANAIPAFLAALSANTVQPATRH